MLIFLPNEIAAAWAPQTRCIQRHGSRVLLYSSTIDWWCLKACISVKLSWQTISARRAMSAFGSYPAFTYCVARLTVSLTSGTARNIPRLLTFDQSVGGWL